MDSKRTKARLHAVLTGLETGTGSGETQLSAEVVPLDLSCLLICQLAGREIDLGQELAALDALADAIEQPTLEGVLAGLFAGPQAMRGNTAAYYDISNSLLSDVRRSGMGIPISLSVLAIEVARRRGVALVGIGMPGHFLVGDATVADRYADPFSGARVFGADGARELFHRVSGGAVAWNEDHLRPATNADIVFRILNNIKVACTKSFAERHHLPWVLEVLSWFPRGTAFDPAAAARIVAPFN